MFSNLVLIAVIISILWLVTFAVYMVVSRKQAGLQDKLQQVDKQLASKRKEER